MNWLRSKARHDRWDEEVEILKSEMDWTIRYFDYQKEVWEKRAMKTGEDGHQAYACRQAAMWEELGKDGRRILQKYM